MEGICAVFAPAVGHQAIVAAFAFVLLDKLLESGFIFTPDGALLVQTLCQAAKVTDTIIIKPDPYKTFVQYTFFTRLHKATTYPFNVPLTFTHADANESTTARIC